MMPRRNALRDNVAAVRSRLTNFPNLSRDKIELALLYYESDIDATVEAFQRDGAIDALSGWTEMTHDRGHNGSKKSAKKSSSSTAPSNGVLRPSQRVSNLFQSFADTTVRPTLSEEPNSPANPVNGASEDETHSRTNGATSVEESVKPIETNCSTVTKPTFSDNRKLLTKSAKDLQRQTSTLSNVEMSFENEMKASVKRIGDVFHELREILKEREVQLYLEMDQAKEQGLAVIRRRQERASELRQRMDRCDRLAPDEVDHLRTDVKQFVTDRRYDLGEELTSSHRFEYDQNLVEALKHFGTVLRLDRTRTASTSINETNETKNETPAVTTKVDEEPQALPPRTNPRHQNGHTTGDAPTTNGYHHYYNDSNSYRRRPTAQPYLQYHNGTNHSRRVRPATANNQFSSVPNSERKPKDRRPQATPPING